MARKKGTTTATFDLQSFLQDMREEQRGSHRELSEKIDKVGGTVAEHDRRITVVEGTRKTVRWLGMTFGAALIAFLFHLISTLYIGG
jgi:hypothetical protein